MSTESVKVKNLLSSKVESVSVKALSPRERKMFGLTRTRKHSSQKKRIDTSHLRWV